MTRFKRGRARVIAKRQLVQVLADQNFDAMQFLDEEGEPRLQLKKIANEARSDLHFLLELIPHHKKRFFDHDTMEWFDSDPSPIDTMHTIKAICACNGGNTVPVVHEEHAGIPRGTNLSEFAE